MEGVGSKPVERGWGLWAAAGASRYVASTELCTSKLLSFDFYKLIKNTEVFDAGEATLYL